MDFKVKCKFIDLLVTFIYNWTVILVWHEMDFPFVLMLWKYTMNRIIFSHQMEQKNTFLIYFTYFVTFHLNKNRQISVWKLFQKHDYGIKICKKRFWMSHCVIQDTLTSNRIYFSECIRFFVCSRDESLRIFQLEW